MIGTGFDQGLEKNPSHLAARAAEIDFYHGRLGLPVTLPESPRDIGNRVDCPAKARLTEAGCLALQERAARKLALSDWSDSMAWYCGHCDRAPGLTWRVSPYAMAALTGLDGDSMNPSTEYEISIPGKKEELQ